MNSSFRRSTVRSVSASRAQVRDLAHLPPNAPGGAAHDGEERGVEQQEPDGDAAPDRAAGRVQPSGERTQVGVSLVGPDDPAAPTDADGDVRLQQRAARDGIARVLRPRQARDIHGRVAGEGGAQVVVDGEGAADLRGVVRVDDASGQVPDLDAHQVRIGGQEVLGEAGPPGARF